MARTTIRTEDITASEVTTAKMATDPTNASNLSSGSVPLAQLDNAPATDVTGLEDDIALLGFRVASNGSLAKYNLVDQTVDDFQDTSGVDASGSTNEVRDSSGKYYSGWVAGTTTTTSFTTSTTWTVPAAVTAVEYLVVGGGGGGSGGTGGVNFGGGGAGGVVKAASGYTVVPAASLTVTVGAGGTGTTGAGNAGSNSVFATITATGGGGSPTGHSGATNADYSGGSTSGLQGPGGAGAGQNGSGADGGDGVSNSITGSALYYGGGAGGSNDGHGGSGGQGGGANGWPQNSDGTAGLGGGGGGGNSATSHGDGGSGVVILKYTPLTQGNMTLVSANQAAQAAPTKGDIVLTYTNGAGTTTLGTDVTAEISADGGSTWTAMTLGSEGSTGSHNIATAHDVTISSTITAPYNMAYRIKTLNQGVSKETRIQAVSLGWS